MAKKKRRTFSQLDLQQCKKHKQQAILKKKKRKFSQLDLQQCKKINQTDALKRRKDVIRHEPSILIKIKQGYNNEGRANTDLTPDRFLINFDLRILSFLIIDMWQKIIGRKVQM